jgi:hypothetical protein
VFAIPEEITRSPPERVEVGVVVGGGAQNDAGAAEMVAEIPGDGVGAVFATDAKVEILVFEAGLRSVSCFR